MFNIGEGSSKYVKVWSVDAKEKYVDAKVSTSTKQKDGTYENSNWIIRFVGNSVDKARMLGKGDVIEITSGGIKNTYDKEKKVTYYNTVVFNFEITSSTNSVTEDFQTIETDEDCPF